MIYGVQQFQIRDVIRNENQARDTLAAMRQAGFDGIELCSFLLHPLPIHLRLMCKLAGMSVASGKPIAWNKLVVEAGLKVISLHSDLGSIEKNPDDVIKEADGFGTQNIVITGMHQFNYKDDVAVKELVSRLNVAGKNLKEKGYNLLYHNHNCEFQRLQSGELAYDYIMANIDSELVNFEFDSYWAADAGVNPLKYMDMLGDRMKLYHINDRGCRVDKPQGSIIKMDSMELGYGCMPLDKLVSKAKENKVEAIILESHRNWIDGDPVKSLQISGEYLCKQPCKQM